VPSNVEDALHEASQSFQSFSDVSGSGSSLLVLPFLQCSHSLKHLFHEKTSSLPTSTAPVSSQTASSARSSSPPMRCLLRTPPRSTSSLHRHTLLGMEWFVLIFSLPSLQSVLTTRCSSASPIRLSTFSPISSGRSSDRKVKESMN
jgi:hypothetical protein